MLLLLAASTVTGADCGIAWLVAGMAKRAPAETAVAMANVLMWNMTSSSFYLRRWSGHTTHGQDISDQINNVWWEASFRRQMGRPPARRDASFADSRKRNRQPHMTSVEAGELEGVPSPTRYCSRGPL